MDYLGLYTKEGEIADIYKYGEYPNIDTSTLEDKMLVYRSSLDIDWNMCYEKRIYFYKIEMK